MAIYEDQMNFPELEDLIKVIRKLRDPNGGCPWDLKQTHQSLIPFLIEESYEFIHAAEENIAEDMEEEIGDVLLQVILHAVVAEQAGTFDIESVAKKLKDKLVFRHPHVFADVDVENDEEVKSNWEKLKAQEKQDKTVTSEIDDSYLKFPALFSAYKIGKKTSKINFDWSSVDEVFDKTREEWNELEVEIKKKNNQDKIAEEMGDLLFSMAQVARHLKIDPEDCLRQANRKFTNRFRKMEKIMNAEGAKFENSTQEQLDVFWNKVKEQEKQP